MESSERSPVERTRVIISEPLTGPSGRPDVVEFTCEHFRFNESGALLLTEVVSALGNPREPTTLLAYWPKPGTMVSFTEAPR
jgi:hypothetical protein